MSVAMVLVFQLLLYLLISSYHLLKTGLAKINVISPEIWLSPASEANVTRLPQRTARATAIAAKSMTAFYSLHLLRLKVVSKAFHRDSFPFTSQEH
jgi:hypothetical protein